MSGESTKNEAKHIIDNLLDYAKANYELRQEWNEVCQALHDPGLIMDKDMALTICRALINLNIEHGGMAEGSIMHLLALRLMDYIQNRK